MKKFALAAVATAAALTAGMAQAYTSGTFTNGFVVPNVIHNGAADVTAVGIINQGAFVTPVFWTFFNQESGHVTDGCFPLTPKDYEAFVWNAATSGAGLDGARGYLVFAAGTSGAANTVANACAAGNATQAAPGTAALAANAFQVTPTSVAFVPVIDGDLTLAGGTNLSTMNATSLVAVAGAAQVAAGVSPVFSMRYFIDAAAGGNDTRITVWSTGNQIGTHTVNMYDDKQQRKSVNFVLTHSELDFIDPETIAGVPANFTDGFIEWNAGVIPAGAPAGPVVAPFTATSPLGATAGSVFTYSVISSTAFSAIQTVLGAHQP